MLKTLFGAGLRIFFLAAGIYAVLAMGVWLSWFAAGVAGFGPPILPFAPAPSHWHAHELIFGYAAAVLGGFFLTAVPSWTGAPAARLAFISVLWGTWLAGRLAVWWSGALAPEVVALIDLAFMPMLAGKIALQLSKRPKLQNVMLLGLIAVVWLGNLLVHLEWTGLTSGGAAAGLRVGLLGIAAMIMVIGGRVTPAFTLNAMRRAGREEGLPRMAGPLDRPGLAVAILLPISIAAALPDWVSAILAAMAGAVQLIRLTGWRTAWTLSSPILWSLHLACAMLGFGYLALAAALAGWCSEIGALHLIGIGAIGGMTLAMMTRAALGHTGRALSVARPIAWAYLMIAAAALLRVAGAGAGAGWYEWSVLLSGGLWVLAFALFLAVYWPVLTTPRQGAVS